tara:strand:+ start:80 stop:271 length:192 start_codon:yes stop_codon:yes gene_type:complete
LTLYTDKEAYLRDMAELNEFCGKATSDGITMVDLVEGTALGENWVPKPSYKQKKAPAELTEGL